MRFPLLLFIALSVLGIAAQKTDAETFYYFCTSHSKNPQKTDGKQYILLTEVKAIKTEEATFKKMAKEWQNMVDQRCKNDQGCTGNLNYYTDKESAQAQLEIVKKLYKDPSRFIVQKVNF